VLVAGQGPIGLMFTRLLALRGMKVLATDLLDTRLKIAREFGAAAVYCPESKVPSLKSKVESRRSGAVAAAEIGPQIAQISQMKKKREFLSVKSVSSVAKASVAPALAELVGRLTRSRGLDAAVIAVPSDAVVREAQAMVRGAGQVLLFSHTRRGDQTSVDLATVCVDEKDLIGSYSADFRLQAEVARLVFSRKLDARRLITHQFPLAQTAAAIELASHPTAESLKVVVAPGE
jgi:L-iditol 2-dehydrogenase